MELALVIHIAEVLAAIRSRLSHAFASELSFDILRSSKATTGSHVSDSLFHIAAQQCAINHGNYLRRL
jgi:hypothetical protein